MHRQNGTACGSPFLWVVLEGISVVREGCFVINLVKIELNDEIESVDG